MADEQNNTNGYGQDPYAQEAPAASPMPEVAPVASGASDAGGMQGTTNNLYPGYQAPAGDAAAQPSGAGYDAYVMGDPAPSATPVPEARAYQPQPTAQMPNAPYDPQPQPTAPIPEYQQPVPPVPPAAASRPQPGAGAYPGAAQYAPAQPAAPVTGLSQLTGGMKFGWLCVGLFMSIAGMLIAWLVNVDKHPQVKKDAILWSVIGFAIRFVFVVIAGVAFTGMVAAIISSSGGYYGGGYYF